MSTDVKGSPEKEPPMLEAPPYGALPHEDRSNLEARPLPEPVEFAITATRERIDSWIDSDLEFLHWLGEREAETRARLQKNQAARADLLRAENILKEAVGK